MNIQPGRGAHSYRARPGSAGQRAMSRVAAIDLKMVEYLRIRRDWAAQRPRAP